jgi:tetratricopeptide (TPR) repeat protein
MSQGTNNTGTASIAGGPPAAANGWRRRASVWAVLVLVTVATAAVVVREVRTGNLRGRAEAAARLGSWDRTEHELARLSWYGPLDREALRLRADAAIARGDHDLAARCLGAIPRSAPDAAAARLAQGRLLQGLFRVAAAEEAYRDALSIDPKRTEARRARIALLGLERRARDQEAELWALHDDGTPAERLEALRLLAEGGPVVPPDTLARNVDEGYVLERCLQAEPGNDPARAALAAFHRQRGAIRRVRDLLRVRLSGARPPHPRILEEWIACLLDEGRLDEARAWCEPEPSGTAADSPLAWRLRGDWLAALGRDADADAAYRVALRLGPRDATTHYRAGQILRASGRAEESAELLRWFALAQELKEVARSFADDAPDPALLERAAELCRAMDRTREARGWASLKSRNDRRAGGPGG